MTELYLVRHGETDWNAARRIQGSTDIPLNDRGREQARRTGRLLSSRTWDAIFSSPLSRALETAEIIAEETGLPAPDLMEAVVERNYGAAEGLDFRTLDERYPEGVPVPGRESRRQVTERVLPALLDLARRRHGQHLVVTTHGGVIRAVINAVASDPDDYAGVAITNGSVHSFRLLDDGLHLIAFDDPIDHASAAGNGEDFTDQNPLVAQEEESLPAT